MTRTRTAAEALAEIRTRYLKEHNSQWAWEAYSEEKALRMQFGDFHNITTDLLDKLILARIQARFARTDNPIICVPFCKKPKHPELEHKNSELDLCCAICQKIPVTTATSIIPMLPRDRYEYEKLRDYQYQNVTFVYFICSYHENMDPEHLMDEVENKKLHSYFMYAGREHSWQEDNK